MYEREISLRWHHLKTELREKYLELLMWRDGSRRYQAVFAHFRQGKRKTAFRAEAIVATQREAICYHQVRGNQKQERGIRMRKKYHEKYMSLKLFQISQVGRSRSHGMYPCSTKTGQVIGKLTQLFYESSVSQSQQGLASLRVDPSDLLPSDLNIAHFHVQALNQEL